MRLKHDRRGSGRKLLVASLTAVSLAGLLAFSLWEKPAPEASPPSLPVNPVFVAGPTTFASGLHMLGAMSPSVCYVLETSEGLILIDTGLAESHGLLLQQLKFLNLDVADLKLILITHGHGDHYLGAKKLRELTGATIYAGRRDSAVLRDAGPREAVFSTFPMEGVPIEPTPVDVEVSGGETIDLGEAHVKVIATPGHTPGSVCYLVDWKGDTVLFSGDTIMTMMGDLGTYSTHLAPRYRGNAQDYLATLHELEWLDVPDLLLPGHPETRQQTCSPRVTPEIWSRMLSDGIRDMQQLVARYEADGADFLDGQPKEIATGLYYLGDHEQIAVYCLVGNSSLVLFDAPGGSEFVTFLAERLADFGLDLALLKTVVLTGTSPQLTGGLPSLVAATGCRVVAPESVQADVAMLCPEAVFVSPDGLADLTADQTLQPIAIRGFGPEKLACRVDRGKMQIILTGLVPLRMPATEFSEWRLLPFQSDEGRRSLGRLDKIRATIWLPARPVSGQNANLYGNEWQNELRGCRLNLGLGYQ